jgi:hypothetical protein
MQRNDGWARHRGGPCNRASVGNPLRSGVRQALASTLPRVPRRLTLDVHVPNQAARRLDGWLQVVRQCSHYDSRRRTSPPHSQDPIRVWAWSSWLVAESRMGEGSRLNQKCAKHPIASACPIGSRMQQNPHRTGWAIRQYLAAAELVSPAWSRCQSAAVPRPPSTCHHP